jgi:hypothetical protein
MGVPRGVGVCSGDSRCLASAGTQTALGGEAREAANKLSQAPDTLDGSDDLDRGGGKTNVLRWDADGQTNLATRIAQHRGGAIGSSVYVSAHRRARHPVGVRGMSTDAPLVAGTARGAGVNVLLLCSGTRCRPRSVSRLSVWAGGRSRVGPRCVPGLRPPAVCGVGQSLGVPKFGGNSVAKTNLLDAFR